MNRVEGTLIRIIRDNRLIILQYNKIITMWIIIIVERIIGSVMKEVIILMILIKIIQVSNLYKYRGNEEIL